MCVSVHCMIGSWVKRMFHKLSEIFKWTHFVTGQILQVVRTANGAQYIIQPQQQVVLQQQVIPQMQPGGVQSPVIQQVRLFG